MKKTLTILSSLVFIIILALTGLYLDLIYYADRPASDDQTNITFNMIPGYNFSQAAEKLHQSGLVASPVRFRVLARIKGYDKKIKAGEYLLSPSMTPTGILEILVKGKVKQYKFTIPEGYNLKQIAEIVTSAGFGTSSEFISIVYNRKSAQKTFGKEVLTYEGYLFPDTYYFPKGITLNDIVAGMKKRFWSEFKPEWKLQAKTLGLSIHEVVTLASIIEKETGIPSERPVISSVFHNRLRIGMRLQTDPTVIYGLKKFNGNLTRKHLTTPTAYNTYVIKGLPPGPIASPGAASIEAALYPATTKFLYFVSKNNTTHKFSTNLRDHNRAVRKYQLRR